MAIDYTAHGIGYRLVMIIAFHKNGEYACDRALSFQARTGAFKEFRQFGKNGRRIPFTGRWLAGGGACDDGGFFWPAGSSRSARTR